MTVHEIESVLDSFLYDSRRRHVTDRECNIFSDAEGFRALDATFALMEFERRYPCDLNKAVKLISSFTLRQMAEALLVSLYN